MCYKTEVCQRCGKEYENDGVTDPRCPECRAMFEGLKAGDGKSDFSEICFDFSEEEMSCPSRPPQPRNFEEGIGMTKCGGCGANYPDREVPKKCGFCGSSEWYLA